MFLVSTFIPGSLISFSLFNKDNRFSKLEKLGIGMGLGFILLPLPAFFLYLFLGVEFSFGVAVFSTLVTYAIGLALFYKNGGLETLKSFNFDSIKNSFLSGLSSFKINDLFSPDKHLYSFILLIILLLTYLIRIGSYSPIFEELDPYYYTYTASQILSIGHNPFNDLSAWYPDLSVHHRVIPGISYLESIWYSFYTGGGSFNNLTLALVASMYPPIAAIMAVFFVYLLVSSFGKKEWGLVAACILSYAPIFMYKLAAGEHEVQPYSFFTLAFFFGMFGMLLKTKDMKFAFLSSLVFFALALTSNSTILAILGVFLFVILYSTILFLRENDESELKFVLISSGIMFGGLILGNIINGIFAGSVGFTTIAMGLIPVTYCALLYFVKQHLAKDKTTASSRSSIVFVAILVLGLLIFGFTPIGKYVISFGKGAFDVAQYNTPLFRTIAEQGEAPTDFSDQMGFISDTPNHVAGLITAPLSIALGSTSSVATTVAGILTGVFSILFIPFSLLTNLIFQMLISLLNWLFSSHVNYTVKDNSFFLFWIFSFLASICYCAYRYFKKEEANPIFLFLFLSVLPPLIVGMVKAKYEIYALFLLSIMVGFSLSTFDIVSMFSKYRKYIVWFGISLAVLQFFFGGIAPSLVYGTTYTLYQNNPAALSAKFTALCNSTSDSEICAAAHDPMGYASSGLNAQYSQKLCALSIISDPTSTPPAWESIASSFRCQRIASYWVDSMQWIKNSTPADARITSWWDYGHWINYFGRRGAVLRNDQASQEMIGAVADGYLSSTPAELKQYMLNHSSEYALFDAELLVGSNDFGAKYGALNYLACAYNNQTDVSQAPSSSLCEADHLWERIFVTSTPCTISNISGKSGVTAYTISIGSIYSPFYPPECTADQIAAHPEYSRYCSVIVPTARYCIGNVTLADGKSMYGSYYLNETYPNGDLKLNKAFLQMPYVIRNTATFGDAYSFLMLYTKDPLWLENGQVVDGYSDRKGKFYDSPLYQGLFLGQLDGFKLVYSSPNGGAVKIYQTTK